MIEKEKLKQYANKLMFDMDDSEYQTLQEEFDVILKQMDLKLVHGLWPIMCV